MVSDTGSRDRIISYEWIATGMKARGFNVAFVILNGNRSLQSFLMKENIPFKNLGYVGDNRWQLAKAVFKTWWILLNWKTKIVHTHYYDANIIGMIAGKLAGIKTRIFTRHHGAGYHMFEPQNVKNDTRLNRLATDIIAVSKMVQYMLIEKEFVTPEKIHLIHHGFDFNLIDGITQEDVERIKKKYGVNGAPIVGAISSYHKIKGVEFIIRAFKLLLSDYPNAILVLANADGDYAQAIKKELKEIPTHNIVEITYENDVFALLKSFDVFVHVPIHSELEAFGQVYVEAMASYVPGVYTLAGIASEYIVDQKNGIVVQPSDEFQIVNGIKFYLQNETIKKQITQQARTDVVQLFKLETMLNSMAALYNSKNSHG